VCVLMHEQVEPTRTEINSKVLFPKAHKLPPKEGVMMITTSDNNGSQMIHNNVRGWCVCVHLCDESGTQYFHSRINVTLGKNQSPDKTAPLKKLEYNFKSIVLIKIQDCYILRYCKSYRESYVYTKLEDIQFLS